MNACMLRFVVENPLHMHKVLLMQWNSHFQWGSQQFHFLELFAGAAHASKQWCKTQVEELDTSMHACIYVGKLQHMHMLRKKAGFNVGRFDIEIGKDQATPNSHDLLEPAGFLLGSQFMHANKFINNLCGL